MPKTPSKNHRAVVFIGLAAAIAFCALSGIAHRHVRPPRTRSSVEELDARAKPHFDEAERNVPSVVAELTSNENSLRLCWLMVKDKMSGTNETQKFIESKIHDRIVVPCQRGAKVYGCNIDEAAISKELLASGRDNAEAAAYAAGGLALEAVSYERQNFKRCLRKTGKKGDNQQKMIPKDCFCLAPIRVL